MKKWVMVIIGASGFLFTAGQSVTDSNFVTVITAANWMPDGKALLLNIVRFDKSRKTAPVFKGFTYYIEEGRLDPLGFDGGNRNASPDGKTIAFIKTKENNKGDIYLYDVKTHQQRPLVVDTFNKSSPDWSTDGKQVVYTRESNGRGRDATLDICVVNLVTGETKQITESGKHKSYNPAWAPVGDQIVYYFEKGDNRDQVWLTDARGSFHKNITNDTSTHNFYPSWIDANTIVFTRAPNQIMTMKTDGTDLKKVEGINSFMVRYNTTTRKAVYITQQPESNLVLYDWDTGDKRILLDGSFLKKLFE